MSIHKMRDVINTNLLYLSLQHYHTELRRTLLILMGNQPVSHDFLWDEGDLITSLNPNVNLLLIILRRKPSQLTKESDFPVIFFPLIFLIHMFFELCVIVFKDQITLKPKPKKLQVECKTRDKYNCKYNCLLCATLCYPHKMLNVMMQKQNISDCFLMLQRRHLSQVSAHS